MNTLRCGRILVEASPLAGVSQYEECGGLEVWPESHWPGFALRHVDVFHSYMAWKCM